MRAIYASKLYRASKDKEKIVRALVDPINSELVTQLKEYVGDEYKDLLYPDIVDQSDQPVKDEFANQIEPAADKPDLDRHGRPSLRRDPAISLPEEEIENVDPDEDSGIEDILPDNDTESEIDDGVVDTVPDNDTEIEDNTEDELNSATKITGTPIASQTALYTPGKCEIMLNGVPNEIMGILNSHSETAGITRVAFKEAELWVYYNDNTNLNNVMTKAIQILNAANYNYLEFNRLARTDNAIVFTVSIFDTDNKLKV